MDDCGCDPICFRCKLRTIQFSPAAMPSRRNTVAPRTPNNSWERGIPTDSRGMPYLDAQLKPIGQADFAANRSKYESKIREIKNTPPAPSSTL